MTHTKQKVSAKRGTRAKRRKRQKSYATILLKSVKEQGFKSIEDAVRQWNAEEARKLVGYLYGRDVAGSHTRCGEFIDVIFEEPTEVFWQVFLDVWDGCDRTWPCKSILLSLLRQHHGNTVSHEFMSSENRAFFDRLPNPVTVYRGCARYRMRGLSWTTERAVAMQFARGMRFDGEPDRVLVTAEIPKRWIFGAFIDRGESEVVLDPKRLRKIRHEVVHHDINHNSAPSNVSLHLTCNSSQTRPDSLVALYDARKNLVLALRSAVQRLEAAIWSRTRR